MTWRVVLASADRAGDGFVGPAHQQMTLIALLSDLGQLVTRNFEATGNYHRPIAWRLLQAGFCVRLISCVALARIREALHNG